MMSRENREVKTYFGRCRCCLGYGYLNNMWEEYHNGDEIEVYGEMLTKCYALSWEQPDSVEHDQICETCVQKLRSAFDFRKLVIKSQTELMQEIENDKITEPKLELEVVKIEAVDNDKEMESVSVMYEEDALFGEEDEHDTDGVVEKEGVFYEDIEYLEEEVTVDTKRNIKEPSNLEEKNRRKKLKCKILTNERNKPHIQCKKGDISDAKEMRRTKKVSPLEASDLYKMQRKTLGRKPRNGKKDNTTQPRLEVEIFKMEDDDTEMKFITVRNEEDSLFKDTDVRNMDMGNVAKETVFYEEIEYLDDEIASNSKVKVKETLPSGVEGKDQERKMKWPKKLPPNERNKRYLQYTADDIANAMEAVRTNKMSILEASEFYKVPQKTIAGKLRSEKKGATNDPKREATYNFMKEIKTILTFTNGTPYKSKISQYRCMYCTDATFDDAVDLRNHTRTMHMDDRTKKIDIVMRPHWQHEILKLDIENLLCVVCCTPIFDWNSMFQHLKDSHQIVLDHAYSRVIPYILGPESECALCKEKFLSYHQLDGHMNTHYDNYVCGSCGDTFLTLNRLKSHTKTHSMSTWPCNHCHKVFNTDNNRRKHEELVHKRSLFYRCVHCSERFNSEKERKNHAIEVHAEKMTVTTCELCGKTFKWRHDFTTHMNTVHGDKRFECSECGMKYTRRDKLKHHLMVRHRGEKRFSCDHCNKRYSSKAGLYLHLKRHEVVFKS